MKTQVAGGKGKGAKVRLGGAAGVRSLGLGKLVSNLHFILKSKAWPLAPPSIMLSAAF